MTLRTLGWPIAALLLAGWSAAAQPHVSGRLSVAAASDLQAAFPELMSQFEKDTGVKVSTSFGSSGNFFAQIQNGAPFDAFFSADVDYPRQLVASGHADKNSLSPYASGHLVIWTRKDSGIDLTPGLKTLTDDRVRRIAMANPQLAPYGRAAQAALRQAGLYDTVRSKIVVGENISQTAQLADSGNAQVALLALSVARSPALTSSGTYWEIPVNTYPAIEQAAVVVSGSANKTAARALLAFFTRPVARQLLQRFGFAPPPAPIR